MPVTHSFASFHDPDGNGWLFRELTTRLPGRGGSTFDVATTDGAVASRPRNDHGEYAPRRAQVHHWSGTVCAPAASTRNWPGLDA